MQTKLTITFGLLLFVAGVQAEQTIPEPRAPFWSPDSNPRVVTGDCRVCPLLPQAKWYFTDQWVSVSS